MKPVRLLALIVGAIAIVAAAAPSIGASRGNAEQRAQECGRVEFVSGVEVVFGRFSSEAQAESFRTKVIGQGFQNANIIPGCDGFRVVIRGIEEFDTAVALQSEARRSRINATVECVKGKDDEGELEAVFGHRPSRSEAGQLVSRAEAAGYRGLQLEPDPCGGFEVMLKGFANRAEADDFVAQARRAGFTVVIERS